jgi:hypothetical protein
MKAKVTLDGKEYYVDVDKAKSLGVLEEVVNVKAQVGGVYKDPKNDTNPFVLVKVLWSAKETDKAFQLLGMCEGAAPNSGSFYETLHTLKECEDYLNKNMMVLDHVKQKYGQVKLKK